MPGLLNVQSGPLRVPFERQLDAPGDCFCSKVGRLPTLHNGLHDIRRQESQADQATHIAHGEPLACSDLSKRARLSGGDLIEQAVPRQHKLDSSPRTVQLVLTGNTQSTVNPQIMEVFARCFFAIIILDFVIILS